MEKAKQVGSGSCSSSSFATELFGPKDSSKSSTGVFGTIFGPPPSSVVPGREDYNARTHGSAKHETTTDYKSNQKGHPMKKDKNDSEYEQHAKAEPCYLSSSIYYGGQEVYSPTKKNSPPNSFIKEGEADPNECNSNCASRGNWWQGSLYY